MGIRYYRIKVGTDSVTEYVVDDDSLLADKLVSEQSVPVSTGGSFSLSNGDTLNINEEWGTFYYWEEETVEGINITLDSGDEFISYLISPVGHYTFESGSGAFFDLNPMYQEGDIIKVYDCEEAGGIYDAASDSFYEDVVASHAELVAVLVLRDGNWVLTSDPMYVGQTIAVGNEDVFISGLSDIDGFGLYFTRSSGRNSMGYYLRNGSLVNETANGWFGTGMLQEGDTIHIYDLGEDDYTILAGSSDYFDYSSESDVAEALPLMASLRLSNGRWVLDN